MVSRYTGHVSKEKLAAYQKQEEEETLRETEAEKCNDDEPEAEPEKEINLLVLLEFRHTRQKYMNNLSLIHPKEEQECLKEICLANGLTYSRLSQEGLSCVRLEMFFSGYQRMIGLAHFPNLQVLCIVGQVINRLENVCHCPRLKELWVAECQLLRIEGLGENKQLRRLYLYSNEIKRIEGLDHLSELETLWLNGNQISVIEGLSNLKHLRQLNLAENNIEKIGNSLNNLHLLEKLELSGNHIYNFKDITHLQKLPNLQDLGFKSAMYRANPVGLLCNYSTHVLFHFPHLSSLDCLDVTSKNLKDLAETTVVKKKMYYNMKVKTMRRSLADLSTKLIKLKEELQSTPVSRIHTLFSLIKNIEQEIQEIKKYECGTESGTESDKDAHEAKAAENQSAIESLRAKHKALKERVKKWEKRITELDHQCCDAIEKMSQQTELAIQRLVSELETGGNVRYEDGRINDPWFTPCHDLILSRFCATDYKEYGISGIRIHRITRIHNRILRMRFEDALAAEIEEEEAYYPATKNTNFKKLLEYLFWIWDPELPGGASEPTRILEEGFMDASTYKQFNRDGAVPLTNSLSIADKPRIQHLTKHNKNSKNHDYDDICAFRHGQIVISKVYVGKSAQCTDHNLIEQSRFPKADSVFRPTKNDSSHKQGNKTNNATNVNVEKENTAGKCECVARQCEWFIFNHELVMPEYVVDFEYITRLKPKSPFAAIDDVALDSKEKPILPVEEHPPDDDVINMAPSVSPKPRLQGVTEEHLLRHTGEAALINIQVLNIHGSGLQKLKGIQSLVKLKRLIVSFNELTRLDDVAHMGLEYLDASFNKISSLEGFKGMASLTHLDLTWNKLQNTRDDVSILRKHCPILTTLDLRHNHWQKPEGLRLRAIGRIKTLSKLNGSTVTDSEATAALRMAAGSRISQVSLLAMSRTDTQRPRALMLESYAHVLAHLSRNKPDRTSEQDNNWYLKVTTLNLDSQHISKLSNLERLENLKWASFNDNDITKIEGLDACHNLEQLSLEKNCISRLEGLGRLTRLKWLSLSHNYIASLDGCGLERLSQLQYFSIDSNKISSLLGLQRAVSLAELYIGNNHLGNIREVFYLKNLPNLVILDLSGNPVVVTAENYRLFVIYHLKSLKALDGTAISAANPPTHHDGGVTSSVVAGRMTLHHHVTSSWIGGRLNKNQDGLKAFKESSEGGQAKDTFGGRLTQDFVAERMGHSSFSDVRELDFPQCGIRNVDLGNGEQFLSLRSVNLEHNNLTSFSGLVYLVNLRVLCLNHNHVECIVPRPKQVAQGVKSRINSQPPTQNSAVVTNEALTPLLENLEVLHLGYNGIKDMGMLQLSRLTSLKALFLQGNEISKVEGLDGLQDLRELVLDRNKIKGLTEFSFMNQWNLQELHMEENRVRDLSHFACLENIQRLFLGTNRIQDIQELEKLEPLQNLVELSVVSNAVARRMLHRPMLVYRMPSIVVIDGIPVNEEERAKADLYFMEQQPPQITTNVENTLPGIGQYKAQIPVKVTNMQLVSTPYQQWSGPIHYSEEALQQELNRIGNQASNQASLNNRKRNGRNEPSPATMLGSGTKPSSNSYGGGSRSQHQVAYVPHVDSASSDPAQRTTNMYRR